MSHWFAPLTRRLALTLGALTLAGGFAAPALADGFPTRPIKLIVPFPPGGQTDALGRAMGQYISKELGQPVVVDNKPGANTHIGLEALMRDPADGYTVMIGGASSFILNPRLQKGMRYDPKKDIRLLVPISDMPMVMVVPADHPAKNVKELMAMAKAQPGKLTFGTSGNGGPVHLTSELFEMMANIDLTHIPYKGSAPAITDLLGGRLDMMFDGPTSSLPHVKSGKLRLLGISSKERAPFAPEAVPIAEAVPGFHSTLWFGLITRPGVPDEAAKKIKAAADKALLDPVFQKQVTDLGNLVRKPMSAEQITSFLSSEDKRWGDLIKQRNIQVD